MESNHTYHEEESMNSSEDEHENIDLGVGRSYECVFCKRGFNTAQALGGHMNIHRKDRARNKQANIINSSKQEESNYTGPRLYQQIIPAGSHRFPVHDHHHHHQQQQQQQKHLNNFATYFPESSSSATRSSLYGNSNYHHDDDSDHRQPLDPSVPGDWRMSFSLDFSPSMIMEDHLENNRSQVMNHKEDLDLELRLGYD